MVDFYTVGPGGEVEKNGKPIVDKLVAARNEDKLHKFSESQLNKIEEKVTKENRITVARKALNKLAGSYPSGGVDDEGNELSIDDKIKQVKKGDEFPYNIPIIGWICQQIELAILRSKKNSIKEQILDEIENETLGDNDKKELGQANVNALNDKEVKDKILSEIKAEREKDKKIIEQYEKIFGAALNSAQAGVNSEQKDQIVEKFAKDNVSLSTDNKLTEDQWKMLEKAVEQHKKEEQAKSQSPNAEQKQKEQAKEEGAAKKTDPKALENDKANQVQDEQQTHVTKAVMQQKNGVQQTQNQSAAPVPRTTISEQLGESNGSRKPEEQKSSTNINERPLTDGEVSFMVGMPIHTSYSQMNKALKELRAQEQQSRQQSQPKSQPQPPQQSVSTGKNNNTVAVVTIGSTGGSNIDIQSNIKNKNGVVARQNTNIGGDGKIIQQQGVLNGQQFSGQQQVLNGQNIMQGQIAQYGERKAVQMQGMNNGRVLQISAPSQADAIINSGATGVGKGRGRGQSAGVQF